MSQEQLEIPPALLQAVRRKNVKLIVQVLWNETPTPKQCEIIREIAYAKGSRVCVNCMTRYGKSWAVGIGVCLYILFHQEKKVALIGPQREQAGILRDYIADFITKSPVLAEIAQLSATGIERLKKEASKSRLTFSNGCEYRIFSAYHEANAIMGFGADLIICDESCLISSNAWPKILRMLGDAPEEASLFMLANPWNRNNYYGEAWESDRFKNIHVGWEEAIEEGRITEEFVEEMRESLPPMEFQVLYNSEFPEQAEDALISQGWINAAINREAKWSPDHVYFGVDIARYGTDLTVIMVVGYNEELDEYKLINCKSYHRQSLTATAGAVISLSKKYKPKKIYVDDTGLGGGVTDILFDSDHTKKQVVPVIAGSREELTDKEKERFDNVSSRNAVRLAKLFENNKISIKQVGKLTHELLQPVFTFTAAGKTKIDKNPEDIKSPDYFDALCLACSAVDRNSEMVFGFLD